MPVKSIAPGNEVRVQTELDLSEEPKFAGDVDMELTGRTLDGSPAFTLRVSVRILR